MTREKIIDRVRKLIALASSPYEEEARSSAFKAASLIREHQLDVVDPVVISPKPSAATDLPWLRILSRYHGRCLQCGTHYGVGKPVMWKKSVGCMHIKCYSRWEGR